MKKICSFLLIAVLIITASPALYATNAEFAGGSGTEADPYLIETKYHLDNVRKYPKAYYKMIADIEFAEADFDEGGDFYNGSAGWEPIPSFNGVFDGNGHAIKNLYINISSSSTINAGLFGYNYGEIKNLGMINCDVFAQGTSEYDVHAGSIIGFNNSGKITNCYNTGKVTATAKDNSHVGGIVGYNYFGEITRCYNEGKVSALLSYSYAGGIVGYKHYGTLENCYNIGDVLATSRSTPSQAGGIAGENGGGITNCYNIGNVSATCPTTSSSISIVYANAGGIAGHMSTARNCYYLEGAGKTFGGERKCNSDELKQSATYAGFDFENVWTMDGNSAYPFPEFKAMPMVFNDGDANADGNIGVADPVVLLRAIAGYLDAKNIDSSAADMDNDGELTTADVVAILQLMLNKRY